MPHWLRLRLPHLALALGAIPVGLLVHLHGRDVGIPGDVRDVLGDAIWAAMLVGWVGVAAPRARPLVRGAAALALCFAVEFSQRLHTPTLDAIRRTFAGHLVLGSGFDPRDLAAYAGGVLAALLLLQLAARRRRRGTADSR